MGRGVEKGCDLAGGELAMGGVIATTDMKHGDDCDMGGVVGEICDDCL